MCARNWTGTTCNEKYNITPSITVPREPIYTSTDPLPDSSTSPARVQSNPTHIPQSRSAQVDQSKLQEVIQSNPAHVDQSNPAQFHPHCNTSTLLTKVTGSSSWFYRYLSVVLGVVLFISILIHVFICMKLRKTRTKRINLNSLLTRKKRRRKRKRSQVPQYSSSSDCSI